MSGKNWTRISLLIHAGFFLLAGIAHLFDLQLNALWKGAFLALCVWLGYLFLVAGPRRREGDVPRFLEAYHILVAAAVVLPSLALEVPVLSGLAFWFDTFGVLLPPIILSRMR